jgi:aerobic-type carbon monoxide dehydrogenase small subunit (CoxS/CutS family)
MSKLSFTLNGKPVEIDVDGSRKLLWILRTELGVTGTKFGCGQGSCGACTVLVDNKAVRSCMASAKSVAGKNVVTIEGLEGKNGLHPLQQAFIESNALQCGYCTPGMIMQAYALLTENPKPTRDDIIKGLDKNLCRCGAHVRIIDAVEAAAAEMRSN